MALGVLRSSAERRRPPRRCGSASTGASCRTAPQNPSACVAPALSLLDGPIDRLPVVGAEHGEPMTRPCHGCPPKSCLPAAHGSSRNCRGTCSSSRPRPAGSRCASSSWPSPACRARSGSARSRSRDAGKTRSMPPPWMSKVWPRVLLRHRRALDVPAGPARRRDAAGRRPGRLAGLGRLPQHEVHRPLLVGRDVDARAGLHLLQRAVGEPAVVRHRRARRTAHAPRPHRHAPRTSASISAPCHASSADVFGGARLHASAAARRARRCPRGTAASSPR